MLIGYWTLIYSKFIGKLFPIILVMIFYVRSFSILFKSCVKSHARWYACVSNVNGMMIILHSFLHYCLGIIFVSPFESILYFSILLNSAWLFITQSSVSRVCMLPCVICIDFFCLSCQLLDVAIH